MSNTTITRLVKAGFLENGQSIPWAPWEINRSDLDSKPVRGIITELRATGKLWLGGGGRFGISEHPVRVTTGV